MCSHKRQHTYWRVYICLANHPASHLYSVSLRFFFLLLKYHKDASFCHDRIYYYFLSFAACCPLSRFNCPYDKIKKITGFALLVFALALKRSLCNALDMLSCRAHSKKQGVSCSEDDDPLSVWQTAHVCLRGALNTIKEALFTDHVLFLKQHFHFLSSSHSAAICGSLIVRDVDFLPHSDRIERFLSWRSGWDHHSHWGATKTFILSFHPCGKLLQAK